MPANPGAAQGGTVDTGAAQGGTGLLPVVGGAAQGGTAYAGAAQGGTGAAGAAQGGTQFEGDGICPFPRDLEQFLQHAQLRQDPKLTVPPNASEIRGSTLGPEIGPQAWIARMRRLFAALVRTEHAAERQVWVHEWAQCAAQPLKEMSIFADICAKTVQTEP
jgi:hypothetical protein